MKDRGQHFSVPSAIRTPPSTALIILLAAFPSLSVKQARAQEEVTEIPIPASESSTLPVCPSNPHYVGFDEIEGQLSIVSSVSHGSPGQYHTEVQVRGVLQGTIRRHVLAHAQVRVRGCTEAIASSRPTTKPLDGFTIDAVLQLESGGCSSDATVELWVTSENALLSPWALKLDSLLVRTPDPGGSLTAGAPVCIRPQEEEPCGVDLRFETSGFEAEKTRLFIVSETCATPFGALPFGRVLAEIAPNISGTWDSAQLGCLLSETGTTFQLYALPDFSVRGVTYAKIVREGSLVGQATASSVAADVVLCPVDGRPMPLNGVSPGEFLGVITNGSRALSTHATETLRRLGRRISQDAGVGVIRHSVRWDRVQPDSPPAQRQWTEFDTLFTTYANEPDIQIEPWITLTGTPTWARILPIPAGCDPDVPSTHPIAPDYIDEWRSFVREAVLRYGPAGNLVKPCKNWEIWQEPEFAYCGTIEQWGEIYQAGWEEIKAADPTARVWAPNVTFVHQQLPSVLLPRIDYAIAKLPFDGFAIHNFTPETLAGITQMYNSIRYVRARLDARFGAGAVPIAVTAISYDGGDDPWAFARNLSAHQQRKFIRDAYACIANAGAERAMWFNLVDRQGCCDSPSFPDATLCQGDPVGPNGLGIFTPFVPLVSGQPPEFPTENAQFYGLIDMNSWLVP